MQNKLLALALTLTLTAAGSAAHSQPCRNGSDSRCSAGGKVLKKIHPLPNRYLVQFQDSVDAPAKEAKAIAKLYGVKVRHVYKLGVRGFAMEASAEQAAEVSEDPRIEHVEEDSEVILMQVPPVSPPGWGLDRIDQPYLPLNGSFATGCNRGAGVNAYVLDSGINPNATEFGTRLTNGFTVTAGDFSDALNHGTSVASIIGGATYGVARKVNLINVKVAAPGHTGAADAMQGVEYVIGQHQLSPETPKVVNMSLGYEPSAMLDNTILNAISQGIVFVVSAGNGTPHGTLNACDNYSPARLGKPYNPGYNNSGYSTITVSATQLVNNYSQDQRVSYANVGPCVDIFAPGFDVDAFGSNGGPTLFQGTSAASPFVAGAVARHLSEFVGTPTPDAAYIENYLKSLATPNVVVDAQTSPNLMLYTFYARFCYWIEH